MRDETELSRRRSSSSDLADLEAQNAQPRSESYTSIPAESVALHSNVMQTFHGNVDRVPFLSSATDNVKRLASKALTGAGHAGNTVGFAVFAAGHGLLMSMPEMAEGVATFGVGSYALRHLGNVFTEEGADQKTVVSANLSSNHALAFAAQDLNVLHASALGLILATLKTAPSASLRLMSSLYGLEAKLNMTNASFQAAEKRLAGYIGEHRAEELKNISKTGESRLFVSLDAERLCEDFYVKNEVWLVGKQPSDKLSVIITCRPQNDAAQPQSPLRVRVLKRDSAIKALYTDLFAGNTAAYLGTKGTEDEESVKQIFRHVARDSQSMAAQYDESLRTYFTEPEEISNGKMAVQIACEHLDTVWRETAPASWKKIKENSKDALRRRYRVFTAPSHALPPTRTPNVPTGTGGDDQTTQQQIAGALRDQIDAQRSGSASRGAAGGGAT